MNVMNTPWSHRLVLSGFVALALALAGCDSDSDDGATASSTATDGTDPTGGMTTGASGTSTGASGASDPSVSSTTTGEPTASTTAGGEGVCADFAAKSVKCNAAAEYTEELAYCNDALADLETTVSAECSQAYEEVLVCAVQVRCDEFNAVDEVPPACQSQSDAFGAICEFSGSTGATTGGDTDTDSGSTG